MVPLPVEVAPVKAALQPVYRDLLRQSELTPLQGSKGRALVALDRLMQAPDAAPLSVVDGALSDLKAFVRKADGAPLNAGQGAIAKAVSELDAQVKTAAAKAGPDAVKALEAGRKATIEKWGAADVPDELNAEPVGTFKAATRAGDAAISHLRDVAKYAPAELPKIGRAVLDDLLGQATEGGAFEHAARIANKWESIGAETKRLLYKDPGYVKELDNFFRLAKMTA